ncbi:hypothetical protein SALBM311S_02649 [Streptomyces alboniger]
MFGWTHGCRHRPDGGCREQRQRESCERRRRGAGRPGGDEAAARPRSWPGSPPAAPSRPARRTGEPGDRGPAAGAGRRPHHPRPGQLPRTARSRRRPSTAAGACTCGWPGPRGTARWPASGRASWPGGGCSAARRPVDSARPGCACGTTPRPWTAAGLMRRARRSPGSPPNGQPASWSAIAARSTAPGAGVAHAESPAAPGLDVLLTARGTLDAGTWRRALTETGDRHRAGHLLVDDGHLTPGALDLCRLVALYDAAYFALAPSSSPGRFRYATDNGPGCPCPVPVAALERETLRRRDLLHRIWPEPGHGRRAPRPHPPPRAPGAHRTPARGPGPLGRHPPGRRPHGGGHRQGPGPPGVPHPGGSTAAGGGRCRLAPSAGPRRTARGTRSARSARPIQTTQIIRTTQTVETTQSIRSAQPIRSTRSARPARGLPHRCHRPPHHVAEEAQGCAGGPLSGSGSSNGPAPRGET